MSVIIDLEEADARRLFPQPTPSRSTGAAKTDVRPSALRTRRHQPDESIQARAPRRWTPFARELLARYKRCARRCRRQLLIERDTPIVPWLLAENVYQETSLWLGVELPRRWIRRLVVWAEFIYAHNRRFRRRVCRKSRRGLDYLQAFMRHWLADMLYRWRYDLFKRLPSDYCWGAGLPERALADSRLHRPGLIAGLACKGIGSCSTAPQRG